jgi:divalent metal cation (Fe/Co/Zn/Cd) transporter
MLFYCYLQWPPRLDSNGYLSIVVVAGLVAQLLTGFWWIDAVTSLGMIGA